MPKLIVTESGKQEEKVFNLAKETSIGRLPENTVSLRGTGVSREHAKILLEENQYYLIDQESGNGTLLNGILIKPNEKNLLRNNDRINIENFHLKFWQTDEIFEDRLKEEEEVTDADILEVKLLKKILDAVDQDTLPSLEVLNGSQQGKRFFLTEDMQEITVGRDPECAFGIPEEVISRQHAKIQKKWGGIAIADLGSKNGTYVNNKRITEEFLHDGDRVALGTIVFLFRNPQEINVKQISEEISKKYPPVRPQTFVQTDSARTEKRERLEETETREAEEVLRELPLLQTAPANVYPSPIVSERKLTALELGMMGLGIIVLAFAVITLVNLVLE